MAAAIDARFAATISTAGAGGGGSAAPAADTTPSVAVRNNDDVTNSAADWDGGGHETDAGSPAGSLSDRTHA